MQPESQYLVLIGDIKSSYILFQKIARKRNGEFTKIHSPYCKKAWHDKVSFGAEFKNYLGPSFTQTFTN